jgi:hypothetical protein
MNCSLLSCQLHLRTENKTQQDRQGTYKVKQGSVRQPQLQCQKALSIIFFVSVCTLSFFLYATRMLRIILTSVICPDLLLFSTFSHKRHYSWWGGVTERKMCFDFFYILCLTEFFIGRRNGQHMILTICSNSITLVFLPFAHVVF